MLGNKFGLTIRKGEDPTAFTARLMRAEFVDEAVARIQRRIDEHGDPIAAETQHYLSGLRDAISLVRQD